MYLKIVFKKKNGNLKFWKNAFEDSILKNWNFGVLENLFAYIILKKLEFWNLGKCI